jgi:hypothetical protein
VEAILDETVESGISGAGFNLTYATVMNQNQMRMLAVRVLDEMGHFIGSSTQDVPVGPRKISA